MTSGPRRHLRIFAFTAGALRRRWRRNLVLAVVYAAMIFFTATVVFLSQALERAAKEALRDAPEITVQRLIAGRNAPVSADSAAALSGIVGVREARPRLWAYHDDPAAGGLLLLRVPEDGRLRGHDAAAGADLTRRLGIPAGGTIVLRAPSGEPVALRVAETAVTGSPLGSAALVEVSETAFREITGMPEGTATDLALRVRNRKEVPTVAAKIGLRHPAARPVLRDELVRTYGYVFNRRSGVIVAVLLLPLLAFVLFAWDKASGLDPSERREIGIMKAVGWETSDILLLKSYEAIAVSIASFAAGTGLAAVAASLPHPPAVLQALLGWSTLYPPFRGPAVPDAYQVATLFFLSVFPYLVVTVIPAWRAATTDPDLVMRG
ncbi:MAG: ABC transporter permease [Thermodesulfobacteriota bacterium]